MCFNSTSDPSVPSPLNISNDAANEEFDLALYRKIHTDNVEKFRNLQKENSSHYNSQTKFHSKNFNDSNTYQNEFARAASGVDADSLVACAIFPFPEPYFEDSASYSISSGRRSALSVQMFERPYICVPPEMTIGDLKHYVLKLPSKIVVNSTGSLYNGQSLTIDDFDVVFSRGSNGVSTTVY
jgi:hypothetical protein